jgi:hypothetical protein
MQVVRYSPKSIVVLGDSRPIKARLMSLGGKWNAKLTVEGRRAMGWIFHPSRQGEVERCIASYQDAHPTSPAAPSHREAGEDGASVQVNPESTPGPSVDGLSQGSGAAAPSHPLAAVEASVDAPYGITPDGSVVIPASPQTYRRMDG